ncbi:MAG: hypothetical protein AAFX85_16830 [Pseudomonadota bacterium]
MKKSAAAMLLALLTLAGGVAAQPDEVPLSVADLETRGVSPLGKGELTDFIVGANLRLKDLTSGASYEAVFFHSGIRVIRDQQARGMAALANPQIAKSARYAIEGDQLVTRFGEEQHAFRLFRTDDGLYAQRVGDGDAVNWRIVVPSERRRASIRLVELDARGIPPMPSDQVRDLIVGKRVTLLRRSTGEYVEITFKDDGESILHGNATRPEKTAPYTLFQDRLVTVIDDQTFFIALYQIGDAYLAARYADDGLVDWELLSAR